MAMNLTQEEINELLALVEARIIAAEAEMAAASHSNQALMQDEIDLLTGLQDKLHYHEEGRAFNGEPGEPNQGPAAAGANAMGGRRGRAGRKTRKARKGRKGSRKGRKGSRKGSRKARKGSRRA